MKSSLLTLLLAASMSSAVAQSSDIRAPEPEIGSRIPPLAIRHASYPLNKTYDQMTQRERSALRSNWEAMSETDEPPFPLRGMRDLMLQLREAATKRQASGKLTLVANVNSMGNVDRVEVYDSPDDQLTRFAIWKVSTTPFKPALCSAQPCAMQFPIRIVFGLR
jgi:hypothetical protein